MHYMMIGQIIFTINFIKIFLFVQLGKVINRSTFEYQIQNGKYF